MTTRLPYLLARHEKLTIWNRSNTVSDDGGTNDDYGNAGSCRGTFIPFGKTRFIRLIDLQIVAQNPAQFYIDLRDAAAPVGIQTRIERADGSFWEVVEAVSEGTLIQVTVERV